VSIWKTRSGDWYQGTPSGVLTGVNYEGGFSRWGPRANCQPN